MKKSRICPYRKFCRDDCTNCDHHLAYEKLSRKNQRLENRLEKKEAELQMYRGFNPSRLHELIDAELDKRCVVFPKTSDDDCRRFADGLYDYFQEAAIRDPSVGIFGMTDGETALACTLMDFLEGRGGA